MSTLFRILTLTLLPFAADVGHAACRWVDLPPAAGPRQAYVCRPDSGPLGVWPAVLAFHGRSPFPDAARRFAEDSGLHRLWPDAVVVYFQATRGNPAPRDPGGDRYGWQTNPGSVSLPADGLPGGIDRDVKAVKAALDAMIRPYRIDTRRIYATGHSSGSRFVGVLWHTASRDAAWPPFAGLAFSAAQANGLIEQSAPVSVFMGMGQNDEIVDFAQQLAAVGEVRRLLGVAPDGGPFVRVLRQTGRDDRELMRYIHAGGHEWPNTPEPGYGGQSRMIVDFFKRHP